VSGDGGRVTVVTDSAAALPAEVTDRYGIRVVPLWLTIGDERHRDGDIGLDELVARFDEPMSTSAPSPGEYAAAVGEARRGGPVVVLTVAAGMSSSYDAAVLGAKLVADEDVHLGPPPTAGGGEGGDRDVVVLDTGTAAGAQALVVLAAAEAAAGGADLSGTVAAAQRVAARVRLVATVADLERLARSGRVPEAARWIGDRLGVRPLFEFRNGRARPLRPAFSPEAARERIVQRCAADAPGGEPVPGRLHAVVLHALDPEAAADLEARVARLSPASCVVGPFSPVMVTHTGRGLAGLAWWWEP
jgi:DegV family protein with EDD domain